MVEVIERLQAENERLRYSVEEDYPNRIKAAGKVVEKLQSENSRLAGQVTALIEAGNKLEEEFAPDNQYNHSSNCPKSIIGIYQHRDGECDCGYNQKFFDWRSIVESIRTQTDNEVSTDGKEE